jgi:hypothetical protein
MKGLSSLGRGEINRDGGSRQEGLFYQADLAETNFPAVEIALIVFKS